MNYWDTSALLKLDIPETDSAYFTALVSTTVGPLVTVASALISGAQRVVATDGRLRRLAELAGLPQLP